MKKINIVLFFFVILSALAFFYCMVVMRSNLNLQFTRYPDENLKRQVEALIGEVPNEESVPWVSPMIPDARTAAKIGSELIDMMKDRGPLQFSQTYVQYDPDHAYYKVHRAYLLPHVPSGTVYLDARTGEVLAVFLNKD